MSPQARAKLPPELGRLTRKDMEAVIYQANLGRENEKIAQLYFVRQAPAGQRRDGAVPGPRHGPAPPPGDHAGDAADIQQTV